MRYLWFCLIILLVGCGDGARGVGISAEITPLPTTIQTIPPPTATATAAPTQTPQATATTVPTQRPKNNTPTSLPTNTPVPVVQPEPTSTPLPIPTLLPPIPSFIESSRYSQAGAYPARLWQPDSQIMLIELAEEQYGNYELAFIDVLKMKYFVAEKQDTLRNEHWWQIDGGWVLRSFLTEEIVEPKGRWANIVSVGIQLLNFQTNQKTELPLSSRGPGAVYPSPDYSLIVRDHKVYEPEAITTTLETIDGENVTVLEASIDSLSTADVEWSWDGQFFKVNRWGIYDGTEQPILTIYNRHGDAVNSFPSLNWTHWSPVTNDKILHSKQTDFSASSICILDVFSGAEQCLDKHIQWLQTNKMKGQRYKWMPDGESISFIAWSEEDRFKGGLCEVELINQEATCIVQPFDMSMRLPEEARIGWGPFLPTTIIENYSWSPDGQHVAMLVEKNLYTNDATDETLFTYSLSTETLLFWGYATEFLGWRE